MKRSDVIQALLSLFERSSYLEVGVFRGETFHAVRASQKVAVDPKFEFPLSEREASARYFEEPSDNFFLILRKRSTSSIWMASILLSKH